MEGIDLAGVVDSDFHGIQINFAPPRPAGFANFCGAGRGKTCFFAGQPFYRGAGWGAHPWWMDIIFIDKNYDFAIGWRSNKEKLEQMYLGV